MYEKKENSKELDIVTNYKNNERTEEQNKKDINSEEKQLEKETGKKTKRGKKKSVLFLTKELLFYRWKVYFGIEFFYIIAAMLLFMSGFEYMFYRMLKTVGYSYLTSELMIDFFRQPIVILGIVAIFFMMGIAMLWLLTVAINILYHWRLKENCNIWHLITSSAKRFVMIIKPKNWLVLIDTWIFALFFNLPVVIWIFMKFRMPKYILNTFLKTGCMKAVFIVLIVLGVADAMLHLWELPYMILEGETRSEARKKSRNLWKNHIIKTVSCDVFMHILSIMILVLVCIVVLAASAAIVLLFIPNELKISVYWTMHDHVLIYIAVVIAITETLMHMSFIMASYCIYKENIGEEHNIVEHPSVKDEQRKLVHKKLVICSVLLLLSLDVFLTYDRIYNGTEGVFASIDKIKITAHRGCSFEAPENTIPAIEAAINKMVDYAEIDVQLTKDGEVVLMHDGSLRRTTGEKGSVSDYTYEELQNFDAGKWFGSEFAGTKIPKFEDVLNLCKGKINLNIEIKSKKSTGELEQKVIELIEQHGFEKQCIITSAYQKTLRMIKELNPDIRTGYIISSAYGNYFDDDNIDFFSMKSSFVTEGILRRAHKRSKEVHVWTVNTKKEMNRMSRLGVDNIITDVPVEVKEFLHEGEDSGTLFGLLRLVLK